MKLGNTTVLAGFLLTLTLSGGAWAYSFDEPTKSGMCTWNGTVVGKHSNIFLCQNSIIRALFSSKKGTKIDGSARLVKRTCTWTGVITIPVKDEEDCKDEIFIESIERMAHKEASTKISAVFRQTIQGVSESTAKESNLTKEDKKIEDRDKAKRKNVNLNE